MSPAPRARKPPGGRRFITDLANRSTTLQTFTLEDLAEFKREKQFDPCDSADFRVFYAGRDDVHGILKYLLSRTSRSLYMNMFGYDDEELDDVIKGLINTSHVYVQGTLDKSQGGSVHEKKIIADWDPATRNSFVEGQSATDQISHTKGGVCDGKVGWEGSTNWSASGEGTIVSDDPANPDKGRKSQNNTLAVYTNPVEIATFTAELNEEHAVALHQQAERAAKDGKANNPAGIIAEVGKKTSTRRRRTR